MKNIVFFILICANILSGNSQQIMQTNQIRTQFDPVINYFYSFENPIGTFIPEIGTSNRAGLISSVSPQIAIFKNGQEVNLSSRFFNNPVSGPVQTDGTLPGAITQKNYYKIWKITRSNIVNHQLDFQNDGKIDFKDLDIYSWPGRNNPHFEEFNGFQLLKDKDLAPFYDHNVDQVYNPDHGDVPLIPGTDQKVKPGQMFWWINSHQAHETAPLLEYHSTAFAFSCKEEESFDRSIFINLKIFNRNNFQFDSVIVGLFADVNIGCYEDDYMGTAEQANAIFAYNAKDFDGVKPGICNSNYNSFQDENIPAVSIQLLDRNLYSSSFFIDDSTKGRIVPDLIDQRKTLENMICQRPIPSDNFFYCKGKVDSFGWPCIMYPDSPLDINGFSMEACQPTESEARGMMTFKNGVVEIDSSVEVNFVVSGHWLKDGNRKESIQQMFLNFPKLQEFFNQGYQNECTTNARNCENECVWPGDSDHNGIANHADIIPIGLAKGLVGEKRLDPPRWSEQIASDWNKKLWSNLEVKHADCDGDGSVALSDENLIRANLNQTHSGYKDKMEFLDGDEFVLVNNSGKSEFKLGDKLQFECKLNIPHLEIRALTFEIQSDFRLFSDCNLRPLLNPWVGFNKTVLDFRQSRIGEFPFFRQGYSIAIDDGTNLILPLDYIFFKSNCNILLSGNRDVPFASKEFEIRPYNVFAITKNNERIQLKSKGFTGKITDLKVNIHDLNLKNRMRVYPNPNFGSFTFEVLDELRIKKIQIFDLMGKIVFENKGFQKSFEVAGLTEGLYFLQAYSGDGLETIKILVQSE